MALTGVHVMATTPMLLSIVTKRSLPERPAATRHGLPTAAIGVLVFVSALSQVGGFHR